MASHWSSRIRWVLPSDDALPLTAWASEMRLTIGRQGQVLGCTEKSTGDWEISDACAAARDRPATDFRRLRGAGKRPVTLVVQLVHRVDGEAPAPLPPTRGFKLIGQFAGRYDIDANGVPGACSISAHSLPIQSGAAGCGFGFGYQKPLPGAVPHVSLTVRLLTDGDPRVAALLASPLVPIANPTPPRARGPMRRARRR